ncbi:hypothetical protein C7M52_04054 [Mixta theicola]|nr:hypothetical protein C7M52_04054 [Mixta theicola]
MNNIEIISFFFINIPKVEQVCIGWIKSTDRENIKACYL